MKAPTRKFPFNDKKFRELILHVSKKCEDDPSFGAVKLNKILYYADFYAYRLIGSPITGATYQKLPEGPAPREMLRQRRILIDAGSATLEPRPYFNGVQHRIVVAEGHEISPEEIFSAKELEIIDEVVRFFWGKTAREVSDFSHRGRGWNLVDFGDVIPYETAWLSVDPLDEDERQVGLNLATHRVGK